MWTVWHADSGATEQEMKIHFGWKNTSMASRYTTNSEMARIKAAEKTGMKSKDVQKKDNQQEEELRHPKDEVASSSEKIATRATIPIHSLQGRGSNGADC